MIIYVTIKDGYIKNWATTDCFEESVEIEYDDEDLEELYKYEGCLKAVDGKISTLKKLASKTMTMALSDDKSEPEQEQPPMKTIEIDYDRYEELQWQAKQKPTIQLLTEALDKSRPNVRKQGYHLELIHNEGMFVWEFVKDDEPEVPEENDGTDYLKPITYSEGMTVHTGLWYTDGEDIWEAIADGIPTDFTDKDYFDIIG